MSMMCGGTCDVKDADENIQKICDQVRNEVEANGKKFDCFKAVSYTTQVVAGTNYFIKVHLGGDEYAHLRVFEPLACHNKPLELAKVLRSKTHSDTIGYF